MEAWIRVAGLLHIAVALANWPAAKLFRYRENIANLSPFVREVFIVQNVFTVLTVLGLAGLCLGFAGELCSGAPMTRYLCSFLGLFWTVRLVVQLCFYDAEAKRRYRLASVGFTLVFLYLASVFTLLACGFRLR